MRKRRNHDAGFMARVALEALKGDRTVSELAAEYGVHPTMIHQWKKALLDGAADIFERGSRKPAEVDEETVRSLHAKIGDRSHWRHGFEPMAETVAKDFFVTKAQAVDRQVRRGMIERGHPALSIGAQCRLLSISRSSYYHEPVGETEQILGLMRVIDQQLLDTPFYGVRQMTWHLQNEGHGVNQKRIRRLMRLMRVRRENSPPDCFPNLLTADLPEAQHQQAEEGAQTYPYLLGGLRVDGPGQVWCADITYLPMRRGFLYLVAIMDWFTRKVLAWRISNTLEADFCVEALNEAIHRFGAPEIMNTDSHTIDASSRMV